MKTRAKHKRSNPRQHTTDYWKHLTTKSSPRRHKPKAAKKETTKEKATTMSETTEEQPELTTEVPPPPPPAPAPPQPKEEPTEAPVQGPAPPPPTEDEPGAGLPSASLSLEEQIAQQPDQVGLIEGMGYPELRLTPEMAPPDAGTEPPPEGQDVAATPKRKRK